MLKILLGRFAAAGGGKRQVGEERPAVRKTTQKILFRC